MQLRLDSSLAEGFSSNAQRARVITEAWVSSNIYCPRCGNSRLTKVRNNAPVKDFCCEQCFSNYELKSKSSKFASEIPDGAYSTLIEQIEENRNPDFLFLHYDKRNLDILNMFVVPKHFLTPDVIKQRKPLSANARRSGWVGCNILLSRIPEQGRIFIVSDGRVVPTREVLDKFSKMSFLEKTDSKNRKWILDIVDCVNRLGKKEFKLEEVYHFESVLAGLHPDNKNIKAKIRQQLQILRDKGFLQFNGSGEYLLL
ncbi:MAG: restriction endonuclease [Caldisericia bacterium]|nr:restriction endonuclease [Caldisericia bacterium]